LIQRARGTAVGHTVVRDIIDPAGAKIVADLASIDAVLRRRRAENVAKKFQSSFAIAIVICQNFPYIEMPICSKAPSVQLDITGSRHAHDGAADIDIRKIE